MGRVAANRRYNVQRTLLLLLMGSKCAFCPQRQPWKLEFHHTKKSKRPRPSKTSRHQRIRHYMQDYADGILVLACGTCNKKKGEPPSDDDFIPE